MHCFPKQDMLREQSPLLNIFLPLFCLVLFDTVRFLIHIKFLFVVIITNYLSIFNSEKLSPSRKSTATVACEQVLGLEVWVLVGGGGGGRERKWPLPSPHPLPQTQTPCPRACSQETAIATPELAEIATSLYYSWRKEIGVTEDSPHFWLP